MKRIIVLAALCLFLAGCSQLLMEPEDPATENIFAISNESSKVIENAEWGGFYFGTIAPHQGVEAPVTPGEHYVYLKIDATWWRTTTSITLIQGENASFTYTDTSEIIEAGEHEN